MISLVLASAVLVASPGEAYIDSLYACQVVACKSGHGSAEWDEKNQEWLDSDDDEPYPDDLKEVDGDGYADSAEAGQFPDEYSN